MTLTGGGRLDRAELFGGELSAADVSSRSPWVAHGSYAGDLLHVNPALAMDDPLYEALLTGRATARLAVRDLLVRTPTLADYDIAAQLSVRSSVIRKIAVDVRPGLRDAERQRHPGDHATDGQRPGDRAVRSTVELDGARSSQFDYELTRGDLAQLSASTGSAAAGAVVTRGRMEAPPVSCASPATRRSAAAGQRREDSDHDSEVRCVGAHRRAGAFARGARRQRVVHRGLRAADRTGIGTVAYDGSRVTLDLAVEQSAAVTGRVAGSFELDAAHRLNDISALSVAFRRATWRPTGAGRPRVSWTDDSVTVGGLMLADQSGGERLSMDGTWRADGHGAGLKVTARGLFRHLRAGRPADGQIRRDARSRRDGWRHARDAGGRRFLHGQQRPRPPRVLRAVRRTHRLRTRHAAGGRAARSGSWCVAHGEGGGPARGLRQPPAGAADRRGRSCPARSASRSSKASPTWSAMWAVRYS